MIRSTTLFVCSIFFVLDGYGQEKISFYGEAGGASPVMSINIDKRLTKSNSGFGFRAGIGLAPAYKRVKVGSQDFAWSEEGNWKFTVPVAINYLAGKPSQKNFIEFALQGTFIPKGSLVDSWSSLPAGKARIVNRFMPSGFIGYRLSPVKKGVVFRAGYNPLVLDDELVHWFSLSLGWKFRKK